MKITFLTLFPSYFVPFVGESIVRRAIERQLVAVDVVNWREFSPYNHQQVDDVVYGGGSGMLLMVEPLARALATCAGRKVLLSPQGAPFTQQKAHEMAQLDELVLIAGRYEGFDERINALVDETVSIGDYVLTGGELPAMVVADAVVRLLPGVIKADSHANDSFAHGLLDYPQYTRPREFEGMKVPDVLMAGNHAAIAEWRRTMQIKKTRQLRPDLWRKFKKNERRTQDD